MSTGARRADGTGRRLEWLSFAMQRADFHSHTCYSHDAYQTPRELVERARKVQIDRIAVTDHHTLDGALRARDIDPNREIGRASCRERELDERLDGCGGRGIRRERQCAC